MNFDPDGATGKGFFSTSSMPTFFWEKIVFKNTAAAIPPPTIVKRCGVDDMPYKDSNLSVNFVEFMTMISILDSVRKFQIHDELEFFQNATLKVLA